MSHAAELYGFDTEADDRLHILDPGHPHAAATSSMVHQRIGAPLKGSRPTGDSDRRGRPSKSRARCVDPARWPCSTPRCSSDAAHRRTRAAIDEQKGRRGIVEVRELIDYADAAPSLPMESEARAGAHSMADCLCRNCSTRSSTADGRLWRVDFAWPTSRWLPSTTAWSGMPPRCATARPDEDRELQECGWTTMLDGRRSTSARPFELVADLRPSSVVLHAG